MYDTADPDAESNPFRTGEFDGQDLSCLRWGRTCLLRSGRSLRIESSRDDMFHPERERIGQTLRGRICRTISRPMCHSWPHSQRLQCRPDLRSWEVELQLQRNSSSRDDNGPLRRSTVFCIHYAEQSQTCTAEHARVQENSTERERD